MMLTLKGAGPLYLRLSEALRLAIQEGRIRPGDRLPGTRSLASELGISRTAVLMAYAQLDSEGVTFSKVGQGTFVQPLAQWPMKIELVAPPAERVAEPVTRPDLPMPLSRGARLASEVLSGVETPDVLAEEDTIDLSVVRTVQDKRGHRQWRKAVIESIGAHDLPPGAEGLESLRLAVANQLREDRGVVVDPSDVIIVNGIHQARDIISRVLIDPGSVVGVGDPTYRTVRSSFLAQGARLVPCAVDEDGFDVRRHATRLAGASVLYLMPDHHFPTGARMSMERRQAVLDWANQRATYLVEDDFDAEHRFHVRTMPPLLAFDTQSRVIYIGNFARMHFPFLRLSFVIAPPALRSHLLASKWLADRGSGAMVQQAMARYIAQGDYSRNLRRLSSLLLRHRRVLMEALIRHLQGAVHFNENDGSGNLLLHFPGLSAERGDAFLAAALSHGVRLQSADGYFMCPCAHVVVLLRYHGIEEARLEEAVRRIASAYHDMVAAAATKTDRRKGRVGRGLARAVSDESTRAQ